jgi:hypothetical protein
MLFRTASVQLSDIDGMAGLEKQRANAEAGPSSPLRMAEICLPEQIRKVRWMPGFGGFPPLSR